jgi:hypothetical protein
MYLTETDKHSILKDFSYYSIHLPYEYNSKVSSFDCLMAIPVGKKYFAWFTTLKEQNVCIFLEYSYNKVINMFIKNVCFHSKLSLGTILYGTFYIKNKIQHFVIENIFYYKNQNIHSSFFYNKLQIIKKILTKYISRTLYNFTFVSFSLPLMEVNLMNLLKEIKFYNNNIYFIQYIHNNKYYNKKYSEIEKNKLLNVVIPFLVKPEVPYDIYTLYCIKEKKEYKYDIAYIPDIKTSMLMNTLFRNIKENQNLDLLEESDTEEEFENISFQKYVYLDKKYVMNCIYNNKFKKWVPVEISDKDIISYEEIKSFID